MNKSNLKDFKGGWFIGNFEPSLFRNESFEVSVKRFTTGESEQEHYQRLAVEYTVIITGKCLIGGIEFCTDEICVIYPNERAGFLALADTVLVVVKQPSLPSDKVLS